MSKFVMIPSLEGLRKDNKPNIGGDPILGPKMRPLCAANRVPNSAFSNLVSMTTRALGDSLAGSSGEIISSEELKRKVEILNTEHKLSNQGVKHPRSGKEVPIQNDNMVIYSLDIKELYPSITKEMASQAIKESVKKSKLEWKNVNIQYLTRYISLTVDRETIRKSKLNDVIPIPKTKTTLNFFCEPFP